MSFYKKVFDIGRIFAHLKPQKKVFTRIFSLFFAIKYSQRVLFGMRMKKSYVFDLFNVNENILYRCNLCHFFLVSKAIFCNFSGRTVKNSHNLKCFLVQKETFNDLQLKYIHFVSEITFEDLAATNKDKNVESRGQLCFLKWYKHPCVPFQNTKYDLVVLILLHLNSLLNA